MSKPINLPKLPVVVERNVAASERDSLPFSSIALTQEARTSRSAAALAAARASDFETYLNRRHIYRLARYKSSGFDPAAEVLLRSVYKPIKSKPGR